LRVLKMIQEGKKCDPRLKHPPEWKCCPDRFGKGKGCKLRGLERIPGPVQLIVKGTCKGHKIIAADSCILAWTKTKSREARRICFYEKFSRMEFVLWPFLLEDELIEYVWNSDEYCLALIQIKLCAFRHKEKIDWQDQTILKTWRHVKNFQQGSKASLRDDRC